MYTDLVPFMMPEIFLTTMIAVLLLGDVFFGKKRPHGVFSVASLTLIATVVMLTFLLGLTSRELLFQSIIFDRLSVMLKIMILSLAGLLLLHGRCYLMEKKIFSGELLVLMLLSLLGMMVIVSSAHFVTLYLGMELLALPLYALIAMVPHRFHVEAAMKYFILGAISSALFLFGVSLIFGVTNSLTFTDIGIKIAELGSTFDNILITGILFTVTGLIFKFGGVPFHAWLPDVYEGSDTMIVAFIGTVPKLAAVGMGIRLLDIAFPAAEVHWQWVLSLVAIASLFFGNIVALVQTHITRLLAYSTISHVGFMLLGLVAEAGLARGFSHTLFYAFTYTLTMLGVFAVLLALNRVREVTRLQDLKGLATTNPWLALFLLLLLLSLAGIPPLLGFYSKVLILKALVAQGFMGLTLFALLMSVVSLYYYLRLIKIMYFEAPLESHRLDVNLTPLTITAMIGNGLLPLVFGIFPKPLLKLCTLAFF